MNRIHSLDHFLAGDAGHAAELLDHSSVAGDHSVDEHFGLICHPTPTGSDRVSMMSPTEDAFIGAGQARRRFHTSMRLDPIKRVFVAASSPAKLRFCPSADFHTGVAPNEMVALLRESTPQLIRILPLFDATTYIYD